MAGAFELIDSVVAGDDGVGALDADGKHEAEAIYHLFGGGGAGGDGGWQRGHRGAGGQMAVVTVAVRAAVG
jgi:hypothetical protein